MSRRLRSTDARHTTTRAARATTVAGAARDPRALACLALGAVAVAAVLALALSHASQRRAGSNGIRPSLTVDAVPGSRVCQHGELLPGDAAAIQFVVTPTEAVGAPLDVTLTRRGRLLGHTSLLVQPGRGPFPAAPIAPTGRTFDDVDVCLTVGAGGAAILSGGPTPPGTGPMTLDGRPTGASLSITYLRAGAETWWQRAGAVVDRMALGRGDWGGRWIVWSAGLLLLASLALVGRILLRHVVSEEAAAPGESGRVRRIPSVAWAIAAVAVLNAVVWSIVTPAFQVPDEQTHFAYAQQLAEAGRPPVARRGRERLAPELTAAMAGTRFGTLDARDYATAVWSPVQQRTLDRELHAGLARHGNDAAGPSAPEPPLYYAFEAVPYRLASGATLLDRLALMRLASALLAGVTAIFVLLFVRQCLPGRPWAWCVGALGVALHPVLGSISGGVNPDALLFAVSAALFHALAVAFRHGLTGRRAAWIGGVLAVGLVAKINFYGLVPGALLSLGLLARASAGGVNREAARLLGIAVGIAAAPFLLLSALDALAWDRALVLARTPAEAPESHGNLGGQFSYLWQVFLPRLPGQAPVFPFQSWYQLWVKGFVGRFGWTVVEFADWAYRLGVVLLAGTALLALRTAVRERAALRRRAAELTGYAAIAAGLLLLIGLVALRGWAPGIAGAVQGRYVLPLSALFAAVLVLAARGGGARWGRTVGVALVLVCVAWSVFGQLLTIAWFYG